MSNTGHIGFDPTFIATCLLYNSLADAWTPFTSLPMTIGYQVMLTLAGRPFVFGGFNGSSMVDNVYSYDTNAWTSRTSMPEQLWRHNGVSTGAIDGSPMALVCGNWPASVACYSYSVTADAWTTAMPMNIGRTNPGMTLYKGRVVVYGGEEISDDLLASAELWSPSSGWQMLPAAMFAPDAWFASVPLPA